MTDRTNKKIREKQRYLPFYFVKLQQDIEHLHFQIHKFSHRYKLMSVQQKKQNN